MHRLSRLAVLCVVMLAVGLPAQAFAQAPTGEQYSGDDISTLGTGDPRDPGSHNSSHNSGTGGLPFSGFDAALIGAAGVLLAGAGFGMRRLTRVADSS